MADKTLLTQEGLDDLQAELEHLKTVRRKEVSDRLKVAIDFGDLSENSEYDDAKNEQAFIEGRIKKLKAYCAITNSSVRARTIKIKLTWAPRSG